jgi:hypothetical protein
MKRLLTLAMATLLTVPMFLVVTEINSIPGWLYSDQGYAVLAPLFRLVGAVGVEGHEDVIVGILLAGSFLASVCVVWLGKALVERLRDPGSDFRRRWK